MLWKAHELCSLRLYNLIREPNKYEIYVCVYIYMIVYQIKSTDKYNI